MSAVMTGINDVVNVVVKLKKKIQTNIKTYIPPVLRTTGIEPYLIAMSWVSPHGSNIEGTKIKSTPAYIYNNIHVNNVRAIWKV